VIGSIGRIFKTPDLRRKVLFTLAIIGLFRLGSFIPAPFVDYRNVQQCLAGRYTAGLYELINLFSGGALLQLSIFALGIMPYITASIITQLLRVVIPHFEALHKEGQAGQSKLTQYTRYLTIGLALLQSTTLITVARSGAMFGNSGGPACNQLLANDAWYAIILMVITMTAGTGLIMWLGEMITERGVGNGMSLLILRVHRCCLPLVLVGYRPVQRFHHLRDCDRCGNCHHGPRGLCRAVAASGARPICQAHGGPPHLRRHEHLHPHQGQHGRCYSRHLRLVTARILLPCWHSSTPPVLMGQPRHGLSGFRTTSPPVTTRSIWRSTSF